MKDMQGLVWSVWRRISDESMSRIETDVLKGDDAIRAAMRDETPQEGYFIPTDAETEISEYDPNTRSRCAQVHRKSKGKIVVEGHD